MPIDAHISDPATFRKLPVFEAKNALVNGIVAYTEEARSYNTKFISFTNLDEGIVMNKNFTTTGGTSEVVFSSDLITATASAGVGQVTITSNNNNLNDNDQVVITGTSDYNGTFTVTNTTTNTFEIADNYTTSQTGEWAGGWPQTFTNTEWSNNGTSLVLTNGNNNDEVILTRTSNLDAATVDQLEGTIILITYTDTVHNVRIYFTDNSNNLIGNQILINNYIIPANLNVEQNFVIPKVDFGLGTSVLVRKMFIQVVRTAGSKPSLRFDNLLFTTSTGDALGSREYFVRPIGGTIFYINEIVITIADNVASTVSNSTMLGLSYDNILSLPTLNIGFNIRYIKNNITIFSSIFKNIGELISAGFRIFSSMSDGTNTHLGFSIVFPTSVSLDSRNDDRFIITLNDDMSSLLKMQAAARGKEEIILYDKRIVDSTAY